MPLDKLTWLKKKIGFDVEAAKKKKATGATGAAPVVTAAATAGAALGAAPAAGWQGAQRTAAAVPSGPTIGANRQAPPPTPAAARGVQIGANRQPRPVAGAYATADSILPPDDLSHTGPQSGASSASYEPQQFIDVGSYVTEAEAAQRLNSGQSAPAENGTYLTEEEMAERRRALEAAPAYGGTTYMTQEQIDALGQQNEDLDDEDSDDEDEDEDSTGSVPRSGRNFKTDKESIDKKVKTFEPVDASNTDYARGVQGATGMKGKFAGDEYAGEHNQAGWREKPWRVDGGNTGITTALSTEQERKDNTLVLQEDGTYKTADGRDPSDQTLGYAMDPKTGEVATFTDRMNIVTEGPNGEKIVSPSMGVMQGISNFKRGDGDLEVTHHTTALGGDVVLDENGEAKLDSRGRPIMKSRETASAGFVEFNFLGQMVSISNASGHYKPSVSMLLQAVEHLSKEGAFFEDEITDAQGLEVDPDSKPGKLFAAVQEKLKQKAPLLQLAQTKTAELAEATDEKEQERLAHEIEDISKQLEGLTKELEAPAKILAKLGIAPSMRMRSDARVEVTEVKAGMTGAQIREATTTRTTVEDFLKSGGNEDQLELKKTMMEELEEKTAGKRETLDQMAEVRAKRTSGSSGSSPTREDIKQALNDLKNGTDPTQKAQTGERGDGGLQQNRPSESNAYLQSLGENGGSEQGGAEDSEATDNIGQPGGGYRNPIP